jgi:multicomponent Na+:H+ antiporter subunit D
LAYSLLTDIGAGILALSWSSTASAAALSALFMARFAGLLLAGVGLALLAGQVTSDRFDAAPARGRGATLGRILYSFGILSLAGLPLTPGFASRWAVIGAAAGDSPWLAVLLLLGGASSIAGLLRRLPAWLSPPAELAEPRAEPS